MGKGVTSHTPSALDQTPGKNSNLFQPFFLYTVQKRGFSSFCLASKIFKSFGRNKMGPRISTELEMLYTPIESNKTASSSWTSTRLTLTRKSKNSIWFVEYIITRMTKTVWPFSCYISEISFDYFAPSQLCCDTVHGAARLRVSVLRVRHDIIRGLTLATHTSVSYIVTAAFRVCVTI
jgi:hypothetical protein